MWVKVKYICKSFPKNPKQIWAWITVSYGVLPILIGGILLVLITRTASSGAMLVGCTIVSQALLQIWPMAGNLGGRKTRVQIESEALNPGKTNMQAFRGFDPLKAMQRLETIALNHELNFPYPGNPRWLMELTISRIYLSLEWCIVFSAVLGTLVWAYGPTNA